MGREGWGGGRVLSYGLDMSEGFGIVEFCSDG